MSDKEDDQMDKEGRDVDDSPRVKLELVCGGNDITFVQDTIELFLREIGDTNGFCLSGLEKGFHSLISLKSYSVSFQGKP